MNDIPHDERDCLVIILLQEESERDPLSRKTVNISIKISQKKHVRKNLLPVIRVTPSVTALPFRRRRTVTAFLIGVPIVRLPMSIGLALLVGRATARLGGASLFFAFWWVHLVFMNMTSLSTDQKNPLVKMHKNEWKPTVEGQNEVLGFLENIKKRYVQSINQSIHRPINQSIHESINQSINVSINLYKNQEIWLSILESPMK